MHHKPVRVVRLILLITILIFAVNVVEAKTYVENFYKVGGVDVTPDSPFPKAYGHDNNGGAPNSAPPLPADYSATQDDIDKLESVDDAGTTLGDNETHCFDFQVALTATQVEVKWRGMAQDDNDKVELYIYNFTAGDWDLFGSITGNTWQWINASLTNPSDYISDSTWSEGAGWLYVIAVGVRSALDSDATPTTDYIEINATVPDSSVKTACVEYISGAPRDWDGIFDDDTLSILARVTDDTGNPISNYTAYIKAEWQDGSGDFGGNWTNATGYANLIGKPIDGGVTDKWRVTFKVAIEDIMTNGTAYQAGATCGESRAFANNTAITPGSYDIVLVGRRWDNTGGDWVVFRWVADPEDVEHVNKGGYDIPAAQKFRNWDLLYWKLGVPDPNHDNDSKTEGVYGNTNDVDAETQPACIGPDSSPDDPRYCGYYICQDDGRCCYNDIDKDHDCSLHLTGYRFGPIMEINAPDHAIGVVVDNTIDTCDNLDTIADILAQPYDAHEGGGEGHEIKCEIIDVGVDTITTEYAFHEGYDVAGIVIFDEDPHEGFGLPGLIALMPDSKHVVGLAVGHRYGIHPFISLVTSMPSSEIPEYDNSSNTTAKSIWESQEFYRKWIYYLLRNTAYSIKVTAEELSNWDKRYPSSGEDNIVQANLALNELLLDYIPYLNTTLWTIQVTGNNTVNTFIATTFTTLYGLARIVNQTVSNSTLLSELENVVGTAIENLPSILGPPDGSTGLNYLLKYRAQIPYSERESFAAKTMELLNSAESLVIILLKHLPLMENSTDPSFPGWNYGDWVADGHK